MTALSASAGVAAAGERVVEVDPVEVQAHRTNGREPPDGAGQVDLGGGGVVVATVTLDVDEERPGDHRPGPVASGPTASAERGGEDVVDAAVDTAPAPS